MKSSLRWFALGVGVAVAILVAVLGALYLGGSGRINQTYDVQVTSLTIPGGSAAVERGAHLARIHGCTHCHGQDLGGRVFEDAPPFRIVASNLTAGNGGIGATYDERDFDRAIRHGVRPDGRALLLMPSAAYHGLSDDDAAHLIAYLRSIDPVDNVLPETEVRPLGRIIAMVQMDPALEVNASPARSNAPPVSADGEYGQYLLSITCAYCHGANLRGAQPPNPQSPPAPDLAPAGRWDFTDFARALRTGVRPDGTRFDPEFMPWMMAAHMTDDELRAMHVHLSTLEGR